MSEPIVNVRSLGKVFWATLTQNGALVVLLVGPKTNESLREAALLAKCAGARFFHDDYEESPNSVLNRIGWETLEN